MAVELNVVLDTDTSPFAGLSRDPQSMSDAKYDTEIRLDKADHGSCIDE